MGQASNAEHSKIANAVSGTRVVDQAQVYPSLCVGLCLTWAFSSWPQYLVPDLVNVPIASHSMEKRNLRNLKTLKILCFCFFLKRRQLRCDFHSLIIRLNLYFQRNMILLTVPSKSGPTQQRGAVCFPSKVKCAVWNSCTILGGQYKMKLQGPLLKVLLHRPHTPEALACVLFNQKKG